MMTKQQAIGTAKAFLTSPLGAGAGFCTIVEAFEIASHAASHANIFIDGAITGFVGAAALVAAIKTAKRDEPEKNTVFGIQRK